MDVFAVDLLSPKGLAMLAALAAVPAVAVWGGLRWQKHPRPGRFALVVGALTLPVYALLLWPLLTTTVSLDDDGLRVAGGHYDLTVPYADIDVDGIVVGHAGEMPRLTLRTNGIGLPGGNLGWFRADDRRVFAAYNGADGSVLIPTSRGFDVVVSPDDAARLVAALTTRAGAAAPEVDPG